VKRLLPSPSTSATLFAVWLVLNQSLSAGHLVLAALLAVAVPLVVGAPRDAGSTPRRPAVALRLAAIVLWDIVASSVQVARLILGPESRLRPAFFWVPLDVRDDYGIAVLAGIITMTPGTLSADLSEDRRLLLVHALHLDDEASTVATIKRRYEAPLREIFDRC